MSSGKELRLSHALGWGSFAWEALQVLLLSSWGHSVLSSVPGPRSLTAGKIFLATTESTITSCPARQLSWLPNRCQLLPGAASPARYPGGWGRPWEGSCQHQLPGGCESSGSRLAASPARRGGLLTGTSGLRTELQSHRQHWLPPEGMGSQQRQWPLDSGGAQTQGPGLLAPQLPGVCTQATL